MAKCRLLIAIGPLVLALAGLAFGAAAITTPQIPCSDPSLLCANCPPQDAYCCEYGNACSCSLKACQ